MCSTLTSSHETLSMLIRHTSCEALHDIRIKPLLHFSSFALDVGDVGLDLVWRHV